MSDNRCVVCGAGGYVGRNLVRFLHQKGFDVLAAGRGITMNDVPEGVSIFNGDLSKPEIAEAVIRGAKWVYNLAANVGGIGFIGNHEADCMSAAVINLNLLKAAKNENLAGYFFASSSCVYSPGDFLLESSDLSPLPGYGEEKAFSERVCQAFRRDYGIPVRIARYHTIYGPGDNRPGREHVTEALCKKVVRAKLDGLPEITIWGNGEQTRSFLYVDDCVEGTFRLMHSDYTGPVNLAEAEPASINKLVTYLEEIAAIKLDRFYRADAPVGCQHKTADIGLCRKVLKWEPQTSLPEGLRRMYRDYYDDQLKARLFALRSSPCAEYSLSDF